MSATSAPDPSTPVKPRPALPWRWLERFSAYKQWTGPLLVLVLFGLGLIGCRYLLQDIDPISKIFKNLLEGSSGSFGARPFQNFRKMRVRKL